MTASGDWRRLSRKEGGSHFDFRNVQGGGIFRAQSGQRELELYRCTGSIRTGICALYEGPMDQRKSNTWF